MNPNNPKSVKMATYNKARAAARKGLLDPKAVNKAFGLVQSQTERPYRTTLKSCSCPAFVNGHGAACKHMIAKMMKVRNAQATQQVSAPKPKVDPTQVLFGQHNDWTAEQVSVSSYRIHNFAFDFEAIEFIQAHPEIKWVRPDKATGRRLHPDEQH